MCTHTKKRKRARLSETILTILHNIPTSHVYNLVLSNPIDRWWTLLLSYCLINQLLIECLLYVKFLDL